MSTRTWTQLAVVAAVIFVIVSFIRSCNSAPAQDQLFGTLSMLRADMDQIVHTGGRVISYDNNSKTTFSRVYLLLTADAGGRARELSAKYQDSLLSRGWTPAGSSIDGLRFCKQGATASVRASQDEQRIAVGMVFDAASISTCRRHAVN
ncbi:hypothetical protein ACFPTO_24240 [Paraburkholderia denitrificans]|uniref:Uncharacterized protein n=1 Tax=Paraburkholderia denitrificans TaxID=694025 RepID=A0ABW0JFB7_9BURK